MPEDLQTKPRAKLVELKRLGVAGSVKDPFGKTVEVQFNPDSLSVGYQNKSTGTGTQGGSSVQFVGRGTTSLDVDLLFDVTRPEEDADDVRSLTQEVNWFMRDTVKVEDGKYVPPLVRFVWGSFLFEGIMESMNETLEFFDPEGRPLRATVTVSMSKQEIEPEQAGTGAGVGLSVGASVGGAGVGVQAGVSVGAGAEARPAGAQNTTGTSVQQVAAKQGKQDNWKEIAEKSGVENPRSIHNPDALAT